LVADTRLEPSTSTPPLGDLAQLHQAFGYTREDVRMVLAPMAADGKDAVWSMGDDTPIAPLARSPRPVYAFFRQRFAQVTNPAIDPLRESCVIQLQSRLGPWLTCSIPNRGFPVSRSSRPFFLLAKCMRCAIANTPWLANCRCGARLCLSANLNAGSDFG